MLEKFRIPEVVLGVLLTVAVFAMGFVFGSLPHSSQSTQNQSATKTDSASAEHKKQENWWNDPVADFTLGLVLVGLFQAGFFYVQLKLIRKSLVPAETAAKAAQDSAIAARLNAEAVIDAERARIFLRVDQGTTDSIRAAAQVNLHNMQDAQLNVSVGVFYSFKNFGKTPAIIKEISHQIICAPSLPKLREYVPVLPLPMEHILSPGVRTEKDTLACSLPRKITVAEAKEIEASEKTVWFYGYVSYDDTFGWGRELRYVFHYNGDARGRFRLYSYSEIQSKKRHQDD